MFCMVAAFSFVSKFFVFVVVVEVVVVVVVVVVMMSLWPCSVSRAPLGGMACSAWWLPSPSSVSSLYL